MLPIYQVFRTVQMRGSGAVVCSLSLLIRWAQRARYQAETPPIPLSKFPRPALFNNFKPTDMASVSKVIHTDNQLHAGQFGKTAYTEWIPPFGNRRS